MSPDDVVHRAVRMLNSLAQNHSLIEVLPENFSKRAISASNQPLRGRVHNKYSPSPPIAEPPVRSGPWRRGLVRYFLDRCPRDERRRR
jgi:hypothetical protein